MPMKFIKKIIGYNYGKCCMYKALYEVNTNFFEWLAVKYFSFIRRYLIERVV